MAVPLDVERWCAEADAADLEVLRRCEGAVLDVGCGPGRLVRGLGVRGRRALGVDVSEAAVAHTVRRGGQALLRSVFDPLPGTGRWGTACSWTATSASAAIRPPCSPASPGSWHRAACWSRRTVPRPDVDERALVQVTDARRTPGAPFPVGPPRHSGAAAVTRRGRAGGRDDQWSMDGRSFVALRAR
ncbi:hypothetical protein GCM10023238_33900 [Streptomyces heliomycini]